MKIAYIAGPYRSKLGLIGRFVNIVKARRVAKKYWKKGYAVICPHSNSAFFDGVTIDQDFLDGDIEFMSRMKPGDIVVMMKDHEHSAGAKVERLYAYARGLEVICE